MPAASLLYYIHDPMCSWCYAFEPVLSKVAEQLPNQIRLVRLAGGLAPDSSNPMSESMQHKIQQIWHQIEKQVPSIRFNFDFWNKNTPFRSSYPACRAVIAASWQDACFEKRMIREIQRCYYQRAENPALAWVLFDCAKRCNVNLEVFRRDFFSKDVDRELQRQIDLAREMGVVSFPSLRLVVNDSCYPVDIDYHDGIKVLAAVERLIAN